MRAHEFITEAPPKPDPDIIELVKIDFDSGKSVPEIAANLGLSINKVNYLVKQYYPERQARRVHVAKAATDADKDAIVQRFLDGENVSTIKRAYGVSQPWVVKLLANRLGDRYNEILKTRLSTPVVRMADKLSPEALQTAMSLYKHGESLSHINNVLGNIVADSTIWLTLTKLPDWKQIQADHAANSTNPKLRRLATTNKQRAGKIRNLRSKSVSSIHTHGVNWW
jgi:hypothetical protein